MALFVHALRPLLADVLNKEVLAMLAEQRPLSRFTHLWFVTHLVHSKNGQAKGAELRVQSKTPESLTSKAPDDSAIAWLIARSMLYWIDGLAVL